jgi:integrase
VLEYFRHAVDAKLVADNPFLAVRMAEVADEKRKVFIDRTTIQKAAGYQWIPIFPEVLPHLEECFNNTKEGTTRILQRCHRPGINLRKGLQAILRNAGVSPWPKLFQNLRASCETELAQSFPLHVCTAWLGHSPAVAQRNYLQVLDCDFERGAKAVQ